MRAGELSAQVAMQFLAPQMRDEAGSAEGFVLIRFLFDSSMSHPDWPAIQGKRVKIDCRTDVFVAEYAAKR